MEGFESPLELLAFLMWLCDLWVGECENEGDGLSRVDIAAALDASRDEST